MSRVKMFLIDHHIKNGLKNIEVETFDDIHELNLPPKQNNSYDCGVFVLE